MSRFKTCNGDNIIISAREFSFRFNVDKVLIDEVRNTSSTYPKYITDIKLKGWIWKEDINRFNEYIDKCSNNIFTNKKSYNNITELPLSTDFGVAHECEEFIEGETIWLNKYPLNNNYAEFEIYLF